MKTFDLVLRSVLAAAVLAQIVIVALMLRHGQRSGVLVPIAGAVFGVCMLAGVISMDRSAARMRAGNERFLEILRAVPGAPEVRQ